MVKKGRLIGFFLIVLLIAGIILTTIQGIAKDIKLGLDLQGGFEVLFEVKPIEKGQKVDQKLLTSTVSALYKRTDVLGVNEPNIQIEGKDRIRVQLAGVKNQNEAREILSTQANLSFRDVNDQKLLDGSDLKQGGAAPSFDSKTNAPIVTLTLKNADKFGKVTEDVMNMGIPNNLLVIWLDFREGEDSFQKNPNNFKILSSASVNQKLNTTDVMISGNFTVEETKKLADLLNAGSLPVELKELYSTSVGAKFGEQALNKTIFAGVIGVSLIFLFMLIYYRLPGLIAVITLSAYIYIIIQVFEWMNGVLTLPGIAALILGVGMAVDANIITYERIRDEIKYGRSIMSAFRAGNRNSFSTIFDANITTIIAAVVLFIYGTSSVKGFATMLIISVLVSFFTAVYGSRLLLGLWVNSRVLNNKPGLFGVKKSEILNIADTQDDDIIVMGPFKNWDFVKHTKKVFILTTTVVVIGVIVLSVFRLNLGIDFTSGSRVEILANKPLTQEAIESELQLLKLEPKEVLVSGDKKDIGVVRFDKVLSEGKIAEMKTHFHNKFGAEPNVNTVSPIVGQQLAKNAFISILIASIGMIIYVTIRFQFIYAVSAIIALLYDAFFIVVFFSITRLEVDLTFIAAVLTIIGYSINDTIVTFDRIRENVKRKKKIKTFEELAELVNKSLIQTFSRSVNTVLTVFITALALAIFGSESIRNFSYALLVGLLAGAFSSLFIASQLWLVWSWKYRMRKPKKKIKEEPEGV